ncbi:hypothetical protein GCM10008015_03930 [Flavobacterium palustre]|uniref:DUF4488 domain-containing protein n=1 Tax=Flavobacterium palustre TaxID=1476463 RepID=A0ABQ1H980_9FLAO|nr:DUF4488 domain-containing protein [Flavobacterium palustre]GGA66445.1 hypothetical protein GCM10008015_03930 [Flavobacterium palustre]
MKHILALLILVFSATLSAQTEQKHIPVSKSIVGIWRRIDERKLVNGESIKIVTGDYKVINADGTYYTFATLPYETIIVQYGSYEIESDSTLVEHIIQNVLHPRLSGKDSPIKYSLIDENTMTVAWSYNLEGKIWLNEKWIRLPLAVPTSVSGVKFIQPGTQKH